MPKSKKPRHAYKRKVGTNFWNVREENLAIIRETFTRLELKSLVNLEKGECIDDDFYEFRDFINWGIVALSTRDDYADQVEVNEACERLRQAAAAITEIQMRGRKNWCRYIAKAEELDLIRVAIQFVGDLMQESVKKCPIRMVREWETMLKFSRLAMYGQPVAATVKALRKSVGR